MHKFLALTILLSSLSISALPATAAEVPASDAAASVPAVSAQVQSININAADAATLDRELYGVGAVKAQAIVDYREANGPFASVDELLEVKGIGAATLEKNRARLAIQ